MGTSQAAVSLKIKRLEEAVGRSLLERTLRRVTLSMDGLAFQPSAQRLLESYDDAMLSFESPKRAVVLVHGSQISVSIVATMSERIH